MLTDSKPQPRLQRQFGLLQATALNMANMVGAGPFITIPLLMSTLGGPQALLGWLIAILITLPDGMVWSELGAAMPGSGGSYQYLREGYGPERWGRLMAFLFIWQFMLSGPLEIASGYIGFANYFRYAFPGITAQQTMAVAAVVGVLNVALLYRRIRSIAGLTVFMWIGTLLTTAAVIFTGASRFNPAVAFDFPPGAFTFNLGFLMGLGQAARIGIYDYLGYYDICYIGDEVKEPGKVIPRSIFISLVGVALIYLLMNLSVIGVVPWREFVPAGEKPAAAYIVSIFMERVWGRGVASVFTAMILWTTFGSVFALLLGYSRVPYAAAQDGTFFPIFGRLHRTKGFPYVSLLLIGLLSVACSFLSLGTVIDALIATRILVQFIGQIFALVLLRRNRPEMARPYRVWLYPLPLLLSLAGWIFLLATTDKPILLLGLLSLALGVGAFLMWAKLTRRWPFEVKRQAVK